VSNLKAFKVDSSRGSQALTKKDFDKVLLEAIDEALGLLGNSARQSTYFYLEHKFKIARKDIPRQLKDFESGLEKIFGVGAKYLEISIMKNLYEKTGKPLEWDETEELLFAKYVAVVKKSFNQEGKVEIIEK
jgi:hypothetical protein